MTISLDRGVRAYQLMRDSSSKNEDLGFHAEVVPFEGMEQVCTSMSDPSEPIEFPNPVELVGLLSTLRLTDYPMIDQGWPLMSKRMVEVLKSVAPLPHYVLPTRIVEGRVGSTLTEGHSRFNEQGNLKPEFYTDDYVLLQITEFFDVLDLERSVYRRYNSDINTVSGLNDAFFKDIGQEYPPIFRIPHSPVDLYITEAAKQALEDACIKGCWIIPTNDE